MEENKNSVRTLKQEELENIAGGREVFGATIDSDFSLDELKPHINNPNGYILEEGKYILLEEHVNKNAKNDYDKVTYTVIGEYDSKNDAVEALKSDDSVKFLGMNMLGEYGLLELVLISKGLPGNHQCW